jgi:hypothetical protein
MAKTTFKTDQPGFSESPVEVQVMRRTAITTAPPAACSKLQGRPSELIFRRTRQKNYTALEKNSV